jgi:RNA polymerase sigma-70 factor (ECF subfamily)
MSVEVASLPGQAPGLADIRGRPSVMEDERSAFVRAHLAFVWRSLRRFGVTDADAPDAVQQVFIAATTRFGTIEPGRERAFLFGTALRIASKVRRSHARRSFRIGGDDSEPDTHASPSPTTEELVDQRRARAMLDQILDGMSDELRAVFVLFEVEQMTMAEIADLLAVPAGTVASRLRRAREYFQERVRRHKARSQGGS